MQSHLSSKTSAVATRMMTSGRNITSSVPTSASVANFHSVVSSPKRPCAESPNVCDATNILPKFKQSSLFDNIVGDTKNMTQSLIFKSQNTSKSVKEDGIKGRGDLSLVLLLTITR